MRLAGGFRGDHHRVTAPYDRRILQIKLFVEPGLQLDDSAPYGDRHCLRSVTGAKLLHDVLHVSLYGLHRDAEALANIAIAISHHHQLKHFHFTLTQSFLSEVLRHTCRHLRWNVLFPGVDLADGVEHVVRWHALE